MSGPNGWTWCAIRGGALAAVLAAQGACSGAFPPPGPESVPSTVPTTTTTMPAATPPPQPSPSTSGCNGDRIRPFPVQIRRPSEGTAVNTRSLTIDANASDDVGVTSVEFYYHIDQQLLRASGAANVDPLVHIATRTSEPYRVNWSVPQMCARVSLYAYAYDACNNVGEAPPIRIEVCN